MRLGRSQTDRKESGSLICGPVQLAFLLILGVWSADLWLLPLWPALLLLPLILIVSHVADLHQKQRLSTGCLWLAVLLSGHLLAVQRLHFVSPDDIRFVLNEKSDGPSILRGRVASIPAERTRREAMSVWNEIATATAESHFESVPGRSHSGSEMDRQTSFLIETSAIQQGDVWVPVSGRLRVLVQGQFLKDSTGDIALGWGDDIEVTGFPDPPSPPQNPGEFDFALLMQQQGISGSLYVKHPLAVSVAERGTGFDPGLMLTRLRFESVRMLYRYLSEDTAPLAEALLLGNRGHLSSRLQNSYINSGTMHLLAISGLHVGILYVFLTRFFQLLKIPGNKSLIVAAVICFAYAVLTDLRPSVLRSAAFIMLIVMAQLWNRRLRMQVLIGNVAILLILFDPGIAYDTGAWLSFVAVGALGWVTHVSSAPGDESELPRVDFTWRERLWRLTLACRKSGRQQLQQMGAVTCMSGPIVASHFHVVSIVSFPANAVMIPLTTVAMVTGFVFVALTMILPETGIVLGPVLDAILRLMNRCAGFMADVPCGWLSIPSLPSWFCSIYFLLLATAAVIPVRAIRRPAWCGVALLTLVAFGMGLKPPVTDGLNLTVLSVGHGNAVVAETPDGRVLVFDAGALRRSERTADVVAQFLWERGYRQIDGLVISHADMDHFNAVPALLGRVRIGAIYTTRDFVESDSVTSKWLIEHVTDMGVPVHLVSNGDALVVDDMAVEFLHPDSQSDWSDNERSLVVCLTYANQRICLPGDLEKRGLLQLIEDVAACDVLLSPHHGSPASNPSELFGEQFPKVVIISGDDPEHCDEIRSQVGSETQVFQTSESGAVTVRIDRDSSSLRILTHLPGSAALTALTNSN